MSYPPVDQSRSSRGAETGLEDPIRNPVPSPLILKTTPLSSLNPPGSRQKHTARAKRRGHGDGSAARLLALPPSRRCCAQFRHLQLRFETAWPCAWSPPFPASRFRPPPPHRGMVIEGRGLRFCRNTGWLRGWDGRGEHCAGCHPGAWSLPVLTFPHPPQPPIVIWVCGADDYMRSSVFTDYDSESLNFLVK